ncbi:hypothetical protein D3869_27265 (plasmid) [Azospirillum brasilense]|uniref:Uncharacterized protein n=1 Tax=Azospirillum brasilense TaxID=192 RepID=A0A4D8R8D3_AZOBR|nr:hypothetical protein D3869_27265 [Azospirillum brasilense]
MICPLPPREREGTHAKRGKGEGAAEYQRLDPCTTLTRPLRGHPLPGRERDWAPPLREYRSRGAAGEKVSRPARDG